MEKSAIAVEAVRIVEKVNRGELSPPEANERLLKLILKAQTVKDLQFAHAAREGLEKLVDSHTAKEKAQ